jgi:hypothetical protein
LIRDLYNHSSFRHHLLSDDSSRPGGVQHDLGRHHRNHFIPVRVQLSPKQRPVITLNRGLDEKQVLLQRLFDSRL